MEWFEHAPCTNHWWCPSIIYLYTHGHCFNVAYTNGARAACIYYFYPHQNGKSPTNSTQWRDWVWCDITQCIFMSVLHHHHYHIQHPMKWLPSDDLPAVCIHPAYLDQIFMTHIWNPHGCIIELPWPSLTFQHHFNFCTDSWS